MGTELPPQRRESGGPKINPAQAAVEAERKLGRPCFHSGQVVSGIFQCIVCRFQINNRRALPSCPDCGEMIWAYMQEGPRPVPEGESSRAPAAEGTTAEAGPKVQEGVKLDAGPVKVQEGVKLDP